jgi:DNA-binding response OmpR family regulator
MRVLLVEDERNIAAYVRRGLEEQGYAVDAAFAGNEALDWISTVRYDLIILDIMLPEMDGYTVCRELRNRGCRTPVLMLTARASVNERVIGLDAGADDYLVKPFALKELFARLRALARRTSEPARTTQLQMDDLVLDTLTRRVQRGGKTLELTPKEYAVLECLMREPERVLTRAEIAEQVWNYDVYNQSNILDVYIRHLRRKIDAPFGIKLIHTVRGAGYRLSTEGSDESA